MIINAEVLVKHHLTIEITEEMSKQYDYINGKIWEVCGNRSALDEDDRDLLESLEDRMAQEVYNQIDGWGKEVLSVEDKTNNRILFEEY